MKTTNLMAFSNGSEFMDWMALNCDNCVKASRYNEKTDTYTKFRCKINEEIIAQCCNSGPISQRTYDTCQKWDGCPYKQTKWKSYKKRTTDKNCYTINL